MNDKSKTVRQTVKQMRAPAALEERHIHSTECKKAKSPSGGEIFGLMPLLRSCVVSSSDTKAPKFYK